MGRLDARRISTRLPTAVRGWLARREIVGLLDELDAAHGAPSDEIRAEVERDARALFGR